MTGNSAIRITKAGEEPGATSLKVEIPVDRVEAAESRAAAQYAKRAKLPGFRAGKAPLALVRKRYREAIRESVLRELIGESWRMAVDQEGLEPIADPRVRDLRFEDGAPVTFELLVEVKPEIALPRLGGFRLRRRTEPVTDEMVDRQIEEIRRDRAPWVPAERERPREGDLVSVSIATIEEGDPREPRDYQLVLGQGQALPEVERRILELGPEETGETSVRFPDDHPDEAVRGRSRAVRITLHEIKEQRLPEVNDDFARELGDFDSVGALQAAIREDLEGAARREAEADVRRQLLDEIIAANAVQAPRPMVQRALRAFAQAYRVPDERLEDFAREFGPIAERQVLRELIIDRVAEMENLAATEEEVDRRIEEIAARRGAEPGQVYASLQQAGRLKEIERSITEEKVFAFLLEGATIEEE